MNKPKHPVRRHEIASEQTDDLAETQQASEPPLATLETLYIQNHPDRRAFNGTPDELIAWGVRMGLVDGNAESKGGGTSMNAANPVVAEVRDSMNSEFKPMFPKLSFLQQASDLAETQMHEASTAAIVFALGAEDDSGMDLLAAWNEGRFDDCRRQWPEAPEACYAGLEEAADQMRASTSAIMSDVHSKMSDAELVAFLREADNFAQFSNMPGSVRKAVLLAIDLLASRAAPVAQDAQQASDRNINAEDVRQAMLKPVHAHIATEKSVEHMVQRFLAWKLPKNFSPDAGITYTPPPYATDAAGVTHMPSGTNLLNAMQAEAMIRYMLAVPDAAKREPT